MILDPRRQNMADEIFEKLLILNANEFHMAED